MKRKITLIFLFLILVKISQAQVASGTIEKSRVAIDGQVALSTNGNALFFNMGGPGTKFSFKHFAVSVNMIPSVFIMEQTIQDNSVSWNSTKKQIIVRPTLGAGIQVMVKRFIFTMPCYYIFANNVWTITGGIGYKILKF
jgi:hypothetical protein